MLSHTSSHLRMPIHRRCPHLILKSLILTSLLFVLPTSIPRWCSGEQEINNRFDRGVRYLEMEQYDLALAEFRSIEQEFTTSAEIRSLAQYYIGFVHQELNDLSPAAAAYQEALALKGSQEVHGNAHLQLGIVYKSQGKLSLAENHLKQSIILLLVAGKAHTHLGDVYLLQRRFNEAEKAYRDGIRLNPEHTEPYYGLGRVAEMQNRLQQAMEYYEAALVRNPYLSQVHYRRSLTYQKLGDKEQAAAAMAQFQRLKTYEDEMHRFREALYTNPNVPILYIKLGELHETHDNLTEAAQVYESATRVHPSYVLAYVRLGEVFIRQRELAKAARVYEQAAKIATDNPKIQTKLGVIYINQGKFEQAIIAFQAAIAIDSTAAEAYNNLARLYAGLEKEMQQAIDLAQRAVVLAPTAKHYDTLAYTYYRNAQYLKALEAINEAIAIAPNVEAYNELRSKIQEEKK